MTADLASPPERHRLTASEFHALAAGYGDGGTIATLRSAERSWRKLVISVVLDRCAERPESTGPLASLAQAWELLVAADRAAPAATERVLTQPQTGVWAAHVLRRLSQPPGEGRPLWVDLGYLHELAAAAAIRACLSFELDVPVRHGTLVVPTLGSTAVPGATTWSHARIRAVPGRAEVVLPDSLVTIAPDAEGWQEPITVTLAAGADRLTVELTDRDPYRDLRGPTPPRPLSAAEVERWRQHLAEAWSLLVHEYPDRAPVIAATLRQLVPLPAMARFRELSASGAEAFGAVMVSEPDDAAQLAVTLVHEVQHQKLGALLHLLTLCHDDPERLYYAPWRDDPRPVGGLLQGAYAFTAITDFYRTRLRNAAPGEQMAAGFEFALWQQQTLGVLRTLTDSGQLTERGQEFAEVLHEQFADCLAEPVSDPQRAAATLAALDHWALWRGHHLIVGRTAVAALAEAWQRGGVAPIAEAGHVATSTSPEVGLFDTRTVLIRYRLADPVAFERLRSDPALLASTVTGAVPADVALVTGDRSAAREWYIRAVSADPASVRSWVGLGLSLLDQPGSPALRALLGRPELVRALACHLAESPSRAGRQPTGPLELAAWIGAGLPADAVDVPVPAAWPVPSARAAARSPGR